MILIVMALIESWFTLQVNELLNGARLDYVREDDVEEAIANLSACLREIPKKVINVPRGEAAKYLECMGMSQVVLPACFPHILWPVWVPQQAVSPALAGMLLEIHVNTVAAE